MFYTTTIARATDGLIFVYCCFLLVLRRGSLFASVVWGMESYEFLSNRCPM